MKCPDLTQQNRTFSANLILQLPFTQALNPCWRKGKGGSNWGLVKFKGSSRRKKVKMITQRNLKTKLLVLFKVTKVFFFLRFFHCPVLFHSICNVVPLYIIQSSHGGVIPFFVVEQNSRGVPSRLFLFPPPSLTMRLCWRPKNVYSKLTHIRWVNGGRHNINSPILLLLAMDYSFLRPSVPPSLP